MDAGANYIVTQMFFDNAHYFTFVEECRKAGINVPIVPGLKPLTKLHQLSSIPRHFYIDLPDVLVAELQKAATPKSRQELGVEWLIAQSKELKASGVPCLHYYTMGDADTIREVAEAVF